MRRIYASVILSTCLIHAVHAETVTWCVYDFGGVSGDAMQVMRDYALATKSWGMTTKIKVYLEDQEAINAFNQQQCDAVVASNYLTREYNHFMGTLGAVALIPNNVVAQKVYDAVSEPAYAKYMVEDGYEVAGWLPVGSAYFMVKDRNINSLTHLTGLSVGVLREDPSQERMARRVGAIPKFINFQNAAQKFIKNDIDVLPAPIYAYRPFELQRGLGYQGGVINFPMAYLSLHFVIRQKAFPKNYGQRSRYWFKARTPRMMQNVLRWEQSMPKKYWYDIAISERNAYQRLVVRLRQEFIRSQVYHHEFIKLALSKHCEYDEQYFECKK